MIAAVLPEGEVVNASSEELELSHKTVEDEEKGRELDEGVSIYVENSEKLNDPVSLEGCVKREGVKIGEGTGAGASSDAGASTGADGSTEAAGAGLGEDKGAGRGDGKGAGAGNGAGEGAGYRKEERVATSRTRP